MTLRFAVVGVLAVLVPASALAQSGVYKWKDEKGKIHFSNVQSGEAVREGAELVAPESAPAPAGEPARPSLPEEGVRTESVAPGEPVSAGDPRVSAPAPVGTRGPFSNLTDDGFSNRVTAERLKLRRELTVAKRELADVSRDYELEVARKKAPTPAQIHDRIFIGVTGVENGPVEDRQEELRVRKVAAEKRVKEIRARYAEIEAEAAKRYGGVPGWWLSIE